MTPNEAAILSVYIGQFAARDDDFVIWSGDTWVRAGRPLVPEVVDAAMRGGPSVSGYMLTPTSVTHVAALDFDTDDGLALAKQTRTAMKRTGATGYVEMSRRGAHLWLLSDRMLPARTVRRALRAWLRDAHIAESPKIEFRPSHDEIRSDGYGSPIRMPTMPHPKTGLRYPILGHDDKPLPRRFDEMLGMLDWTPAWIIESAADTVRPTPQDAARGDRRAYSGPTVEGTASDILRRLWGVVDARAGHSVRCPSHEDRVASLNILPDDERALCMAPHCRLNNDGHGRGTYELTQMAPKRWHDEVDPDRDSRRRRKDTRLVRVGIVRP